jgi:SAM-dependent methyltransferase
MDDHLDQFRHDVKTLLADTSRKFGGERYVFAIPLAQNPIRRSQFPEMFVKEITLLGRECKSQYLIDFHLFALERAPSGKIWAAGFTMTSNYVDQSRLNYQAKRKQHWNTFARKLDHWRSWGKTYHRRIEEIYSFLISPGSKVLEIGCGEGDLLAAIHPSAGVGIDFSEEMIRRASDKHPDLNFVIADAHDLAMLDGKFDFIILSDTIDDLWDVQEVFQQIFPLCERHTRLILNLHSYLWESPILLAQKLGLAVPTLQQNWLVREDITNILHLTGFEPVRIWQEFLEPLPVPFIDDFVNCFVVRFWPFRELALTNFLVARPLLVNKELPKVSVIIPARNEAGNISAIFERVPQMGSETELIFVEGHSKDNTCAVIEQEMKRHPEQKSGLFNQQGIGKANAVLLGFEKARGDILMILDADLTVPPEDLPRFYDALVSGKGEFINGVRLVYPMEKQAMRLANLLGNKFFSLVFSWMLGQSIKDTLCGTKALWRSDHQKIVANRSYFGDFDPFGDYDLIFGAAKLNLKIVDLPIRYRERTYGATNISRWKHGWLLLKMVIFAALRLKFI